jgi:hypothetical protein
VRQPPDLTGFKNLLGLGTRALQSAREGEGTPSRNSPADQLNSQIEKKSSDSKKKVAIVKKRALLCETNCFKF